MPKQNKLNQHGSALVIVLILIASMMITTVAVMQNSSSLSQIFAQKSQSQSADNVSQVISSIMAEARVCLQGFDGVGGEAGLQFTPTPFSLGGAQGTNQLDVSLPSSFQITPGAARIRLQATQTIPGTDLRIEKIYVTAAATPSPSIPNTYDMDLMAQFASVQGANVRGLSVRKIMKLRVETPAAGVITACGPAPAEDSNRALCEGMNCTYNISASGERSCFCKIEPMTCLPGHYVSSIGSDYVPRCSAAPLQRVCGAPSNYLVALDSQSNAVCAEVVTCPTGTSTAGLGGTANPPGCKCAFAGQVWNGSACGIPTPALCGIADGTTLATAPTVNLCTSGTPSALSGSGPWAWTCADSFGGASDSCSANLAVAPPPPPPPPPPPDPTCSVCSTVAGTQAMPFMAMADQCLPGMTAEMGLNCLNGTSYYGNCGMPCGSPPPPASGMCPNGDAPHASSYLTQAACESNGPASCNPGTFLSCMGGAGWRACCGGTPPPPPSSCIAGSSTTGAGPLVLSGPCRCNNATDTFNGMNCVAAGAGIPWVQVGGPGGATTTCTGSAIYSETAAGGIFARIVNDPVTGFETYQQVVPAGAACLLETTNMCCWGNVDSTRTFYTGPPANPSDPGLSRYEGSACRTAGQLIVGDFVVACTVGTSGSHYDCCSNSWTCVPNGATPARRCN